MRRVLQIANAAGQATMAVYSAMTGTEVSRKDDGSPLNQADLAAHRVIARGLTELTP